MSVSYSASIVVGIPLKEIWERGCDSKQETRYNNITGLPYTDYVKTNKYYLLGKSVKTASIEIALDILGIQELEIYYEHYNDEAILGIQIIETHDDCKEFSISSIENTINKVSKILLENGLKPEGVALIKPYLVPYVSY